MSSRSPVVQLTSVKRGPAFVFGGHVGAQSARLSPALLIPAAKTNAGPDSIACNVSSHSWQDAVLAILGSNSSCLPPQLRQKCIESSLQSSATPKHPMQPGAGRGFASRTLRCLSLSLLLLRHIAHAVVAGNLGARST